MNQTLLILFSGVLALSVAQTVTINIDPIGAVVEGNNLTISCSDGRSQFVSALRLRENGGELTGSSVPPNVIIGTTRTFYVPVNRTKNGIAYDCFSAVTRNSSDSVTLTVASHHLVHSTVTPGGAGDGDGADRGGYPTTTGDDLAISGPGEVGRSWFSFKSKGDSHWTVSVAGSDVRESEDPNAAHTTVPPSASLRTPLKVSIVLSSPLTVTISIPVKLVPVIRTIDADDPLGVNRQPNITPIPFSSPMHWKVAFPPSTTVVS